MHAINLSPPQKKNSKKNNQIHSTEILMKRNYNWKVFSKDVFKKENNKKD